MSTRSAIICKTASGYFGIYCHSDGYPSWMGNILHHYYTTQQAVEELISLGDLSSISHTGEAVAYHRDRGEAWTESIQPVSGTTAAEVAELIDHNDQVYVFENGTWSHNGKPLIDILASPEVLIQTAEFYQQYPGFHLPVTRNMTAEELQKLGYEKAEQPSSPNIPMSQSPNLFSFRSFQKDDMARAALQNGALLGWEPGLGKTMPAFSMPWLWRARNSLIVVQADLHEQLIIEGREKFGVNVRVIDSQETAYDLMRKGILPMPGQTLTPLKDGEMPDYFITAYNWLGYIGGDEWESAEPNELLRNRRISIAARFLGIQSDNATLIAVTSRDNLNSKTSPHQLLGIPENATAAEIKSAYRTAAKLYHPDLHPGDTTAESRFVLINAAYEKLTGKDTRNYDVRLAELTKMEPNLHSQFVTIQSLQDGIGTERHYENGHTIKCVFTPTLSSIIHSAFACVVCDEAVAIKSGTAFAAEGVLRLNPTYRLGLTGTPIKNKLPDIFFLASWVTGFKSEPHARFPYSNTTEARANFSSDFGVMEENLTKKEQSAAKGEYRRYTKTDPTRICNVHRLWRTLGPILIRRRKDSLPDCDIVQKTIIPIHTMPGTRQLATYRYHVDTPPAHDSILAQRGAQLTCLRMAALHPADPKLRRIDEPRSVSTGIFTPKIAAILKLATDLMAKGEQLVIFSPFTSFSSDLSAILTRSAIPHLTLDGRVNPVKRGKLIKEFKSGKFPILIAGIKGMASGHNLDCCPNLVLPGIEWALDLNRQAVDRIHRLTSKQEVKIYVIITKGTIDERLAAAWQEKGDSADLALDGRLIEEEKEPIDIAEFLRQAVADFDPTAQTLSEDEVAAQWQASGQREALAALQTYRKLRPVKEAKSSPIKNPKSSPINNHQSTIINHQSSEAPTKKPATPRTVFQILQAARAIKATAPTEPTPTHITITTPRKLPISFKPKTETLTPA